MTKVGQYLDLLDATSPLIRSLFGNKEIAELENDLQAIIPLLKMVGLIK